MLDEQALGCHLSEGSQVLPPSKVPAWSHLEADVFRAGLPLLSAASRVDVLGPGPRLWSATASLWERLQEGRVRGAVGVSCW